MKKRYVLVATDKDTGQIFVSPDTVREFYTKEDVEQIIKHLPKAIKEMREFSILPYEQAIFLRLIEWDQTKPKSKVIH